MISFNSLLRAESIDPATVKLVRHQDKRISGRPTPYQLWKMPDGSFEKYQSIQKRPKIFAEAKFLAAFVATPLNETLFVGLYAIRGHGKAPAGLIDPISGESVEGMDLYDLKLLPALKDYQGRLSIVWGDGYRAWVQRAETNEKNILEIRRNEKEPPFPGFLDFREQLSRLSSVPVAWREVLSSVGGIYLLTCPRTGKQYVGSAHGSAGFWGRWEEYAASGHGGNCRMMDVPDSDYQVGVLEVAASSTSVENLIEMESRWKEKLQTRKFGLNAN
jgi:hypothetical protein